VSPVDAAVAAIGRGELVVIPTDTVYGLACSPYGPEPVRRLSELKGRSSEQPIALVASSVEWLLECVPELRGRAAVAARVLLPGAFTLVLPNPARRFAWLTGPRPDTIGVRVPAVEGVTAETLGALGVVAATSANIHGGPDPRRVADVPEEMRESAGAIVDDGELPGVPSTVVDLTGPGPVVLREGAITAAETLQRVATALAQ